MIIGYYSFLWVHVAKENIITPIWKLLADIYYIAFLYMNTMGTDGTVVVIVSWIRQWLLAGMVICIIMFVHPLSLKTGKMEKSMHNWYIIECGYK